jgi:hypothetical protein
VSDKITLVVRFRMKEPAKQEFTAKLQDVFTHIVKEETFVEASLKLAKAGGRCPGGLPHHGGRAAGSSEPSQGRTKITLPSGGPIEDANGQIRWQKVTTEV